MIAIAFTIALASIPPRTKLPESHEYQRVLRDHIGTLALADFTHGVEAPIAETPATDDPERLYRNHLLTLMAQPLVGTKRGYPSVNAPPRLFLLSSIEHPAGVLAPPVWPETLIAFVNWDHAGNPYRGNRALKLRAFVSASVLMVMLDDALDGRPDRERADRYAYHLVYFARSYPGFKDVLPPKVRVAFESGMKRVAARMMGWGVRGEAPHNDVILPFGLACVVRAVDDPAFAKSAESFARKLYADPLRFNPAGYWNHRGGLDIPFMGQANYFSVGTALAAEWPFVNDAVERAYRLRGHLILPEPDGAFSGPSHFNVRVSGPASINQWMWNGARDAAAAMVTDEAAHLVKMPTAEMLKAAPAERARAFAGQIRENPVNSDGSGFAKNEELASWKWNLRIWSTYNFPATVNPAYEFYRPGTLARRRELDKANSPMLKSPFERGETFLRDFNKSFVVARQPGFAAILHTGPVAGPEPGERFAPFPGPMGFGGGQLSAFWTPATGSVLLGQRGGMTNDVCFDRIDAWRTWPLHAVSGVTKDGTVFTSARIRKPQVNLDTKGNTATVRVSGTIPGSIEGQEKSIATKYEYCRAFEIAEGCVAVETSLSGADAEPLAELYETLPVYLRDVQTQPKATPTKIEWQVGGKWVEATDAFAEKVEAIRLTRFTGAVKVAFDSPRRVRLAPAEWADTFLSRGTARTVLIDLLQDRRVKYRIEPVRQ